MSLKSIIFVKPYDKLLTQLLTAFGRGNAPVNILEAETPEEVTELLENHYPAIVLINAPKTCLHILSINVKVLRMTSSKTLLITPNLLPQKLIQKLQKFGLTENIESTIAARSLLYKVQLLLRSLPQKDLIEMGTKAPSLNKKTIKDKAESHTIFITGKDGDLDDTQIEKRNEKLEIEFGNKELVEKTNVSKNKTSNDNLVIKGSNQTKSNSSDIMHVTSPNVESDNEDEELLDNDTRELLNEFCNESEFLLSQLKDAMEQFEKNTSETKLLEEYGQVIDRMMGSAQTIGLKDFASYCELGKLIGYKASQSKNPILLEIVVAILIDTTLLLQDMILEIRTGTKKILKNNPKHKTFVGRLKWLSKKFAHIERSSVEPKGDEVMEQKSIDDLLESLGL